jgi:glycine/D-amino acid oxidase-like deaminating enzyme
VIGRLNKLPGVYVAVMHSGVSLAAIVGKLATQEILDGSSNIILQDFRPSRFN